MAFADDTRVMWSLQSLSWSGNLTQSVVGGSAAAAAWAGFICTIKQVLGVSTSRFLGFLRAPTTVVECHNESPIGGHLDTVVE